jgi:hypothetical protein
MPLNIDGFRRDWKKDDIFFEKREVFFLFQGGSEGCLKNLIFFYWNKFGAVFLIFLMLSHGSNSSANFCHKGGLRNCTLPCSYSPHTEYVQSRSKGLVGP